MKLRSDQVFTRGVMFGDGARGAYTQIHNVVDQHGNYLGVQINIGGNKNDSSQTVRRFCVDDVDQTFDNLKDALAAAGHELEEE